MQITLDCFPCIYRQVLEISRLATDDEDIIREILNDFAEMIPDIDDSTKTPPITAQIHKIVAEKTGIRDPYYEYKQKNIELAESFVPKMKDIIKSADNQLLWRLVVSALGNSLDAGVELEMELKTIIESALQNSLARSDYDIFQKMLENAEHMLFIADNAGEAVFDRLLLKQLSEFVNITYAVRERPVLNDITLQEAKKINIGKYSNVISSGSAASGTILSETNENFRQIFHSADIRLSKGQGNLEGLNEEPQDIFFLLKAKCEPVADLLQVEVRDLVFILNG